jgi:O-antigen/teichoic acid export membrane protein
MTDQPPALDLGPGGTPAAAPSPETVEAGRGPSASRAILWSMGGQLLTTFASLVSTVVLARILTPTDFGAFAFAATVYALVQWLLQVGMGNYLLREATLSQAKIDGAVAITGFQGLVASAIVLALAPFAGWFAHFPQIGWVTCAVAIVPFLCAPEAISDALWLRHGQVKRTALLQVVKSGNQSLVSIGCQLAFGWGVFSLVAGLLAAGLTSFVAAAWSLLREYRARPRMAPEVSAVLRGFGGRTFVLTLAQIVSMRLPDLLIGRVLSVGLLGHYNRATSALDMFGRTTSAAVTRATAPRFYARAHQGHDLGLATVAYADTLLFFVWPALAGMAVLAGPVVHLIFGPQWGIAGRALPFLCLVAMIDLARTGYSEVFLVRDKLGWNAVIEFAHGAYAIGLVVLLARFGLMAVLWGKVAESLATTLIYLAAMRGLRGHAARGWPGLFGRNGLLALAAGLPAWALMRGWGWPVSLDLGRFVLAIAAGGVGWLAMLALLGHPNLKAGVAMARARLARAV